MVLSAAVTTPSAGTGADRPAIGVVDLHVDLPYRLNYGQRSLGEGTGQYRSAHLERAGVIGVVLPLYIPREVSPTGPRLEDLESSYRRVVEAIPRTPPYALPGCATERGRVQTWLSMEGAGPLAAEPERVADWVRRGVWLFGLVHTYDNELATSSGSPGPHRVGLTAAGREVVRRVFEAGATVDVSHASDRATTEILDLAGALSGVVVASHSNARKVADHPRNLTDDQARRIAQTGGVVGVNFHARFLTGRARATLDDVLRQIRHLVAVAGVEHVAIGSDFEGGIRPPTPLADIRGFRTLADALLTEGMSAEDVAKIFHGNALRVLCGRGR
jgi:membrane dipeptidase